MLNQLTPLIKLATAEEEEKFAQFIKEQRKLHIKPPKETALDAAFAHEAHVQLMLKKGEVSNIIIALREWSYDEFLKEEALFNAAVLSQIGQQFNAPKEILKVASNELFKLNIQSADAFQAKLSELFGIYAGHISPYI